MIQRISDRLQRNRDDAGFTLIELMVVVLIIAILIAIAIPTFLGARGRAQDRAAQSSLRNTVTGAKAIFTDDEDYGKATDTELAAAEPALQFVPAGTPSNDPPNQVSVDPGTSPSSVFTAAAKSANGARCWYIRDAVDPDGFPGTWWALTEPAVDGCTATAAPADAAAGDFNVDGGWVRSPGDAVAP